VSTKRNNSSVSPPRLALVVHPDMRVVSELQSALSNCGFTAIVARDLPTALLAITQHYFEIALVSAHLHETGDGWPLAGVLHLVFPRAFVGVLAAHEPDILTLQSAINYGVREVYQQSTPALEVVASIMAQMEPGNRGSQNSSVQ
jgi:ActR/RegA family two-component response regulator